MLLTFLEEIKDFRRPQGQRYELKFIVLFSIMGILSGCDSYRSIAYFINIHFKKLDHYFYLKWKNPPSYTTIRNILSGIENQELEACFRAYTQSLFRLTSSETNTLHISVDGKSVRGSAEKSGDKAVHFLNFFISEYQLILGHIQIEEKSNEIPAFHHLLEQLELEHVIYTADAMHCQKKTFETVPDTCFLLTQVKDNQKELKEACDDIAYYTKPTHRDTQIEKNNGRIETRIAQVHYEHDEFIRDGFWQKTVETVIKIERTVEKPLNKISQEIAYYISNKKLTAKQANFIIRKHWAIENENHFVRDVAFKEDKSRVKHNPMNLVVLRSFALNVLRKNKCQDIKQTLFQNALDYNRLYSYKHFI